MTEPNSHDALIRSLASGLAPIRRLPSPWARTLLFLLACAALAGVVIALGEGRSVWDKFADPAEAIGMAAALATAALAALSAFQLATPGRSPWFVLLPVPTLALWVLSSGYGCWETMALRGSGSASDPLPRACFQSIVLLSIPLSIALFLLLRRTYSTRPALAATMAGLAAAAAAAALLEIVHPVGVTVMDLAAHAAAIAVVIVLTRLIGGPLLQRLALVLAIVLPASAVPAQEARPVVVELFTSQGCSSCPPADALLTELARDRRDLLPLAFHVDYWNRLGWTDPFSSAAFTDRERRHAEHLGEPTVYTPEIVVDGGQAVVGSDRADVDAAIRAAKSRSITLAAMSASRTGPGDLAITVGPGEGAATILLVGYDRSHLTPIGRGENSGRTLQESNIVRSLQAIGQWNGQSVKLRHAWPAGEQAAVLLEAQDGRIVGAAIAR